LLPYGCPTGLIFFLPIVELISQIIRPLTLMVRLRTNLAAGHIILYIFSYFALLSNILTPLIYFLLVALFTLEVFISILQAYILITLIGLYVEETLN
jgi:F-type H+-transporting ATPase subunit a